MYGEGLSSTAIELFESTIRLAEVQRKHLAYLSDAIVNAIRSTDKTIEVMHKLKEIIRPKAQKICCACGMVSMVEIEPRKWKCEICDFGEP